MTRAPGNMTPGVMRVMESGTVRCSMDCTKGGIRRGTTRRGMTLIELIIGIVITGAATAAGYGAFASIIDSRERFHASTTDVRRAAATRATISTWLAPGLLVLDSVSAIPSGGSAIGVSEPNDEVTFIATSPTPLNVQQTIIRLFIDRDPFTPETGLVAEMRSAQSGAVDDPLAIEQLRIVELASRIMGLEVRYLTTETASWVTRFELGALSPTGVMITLHAAARDTLPAILRLPIVVPAGTTR